MAAKLSGISGVKNFNQQQSAWAASALKEVEKQRRRSSVVVEGNFFKRLSKPLIERNSSDDSRSSSFIDELPNDQLNSSKFLKLNVGGTSYKLKMQNINKRTRKSLIYQMAHAEHQKRAEMADCYFEETDEYYFERSAMLFDWIYLYYITGRCHKPQIPCLELFADELEFWNLKDIFFPSCCWEKVKENGTLDDAVDEEESTSVVSYKEMFRGIRCGTLRRKVFELIEIPESSLVARTFSFVSIGAVLISVMTLILGSIPQFQVPVTVVSIPSNNTTTTLMEPHPVLEKIEYGCIAFFTIEYIAKMVVAPHRKQLFFETMNLIDLIAILPTYLELLLHLIGFDTDRLAQVRGALLVMRILRVLRVIRLLKLGRHSVGLKIFATTMDRSKAQLGMLLVVLAIGIVFFSTVLYFIEKDEPTTKFYNIPAGCWWCIVTMSTVGYGDMYPTTVIGKMVGSFCIACGCLVLALPITVMVENFMRVQFEYKQLARTQQLEKERKLVVQRKEEEDD